MSSTTVSGSARTTTPDVPGPTPRAARTQQLAGIAGLVFVVVVVVQNALRSGAPADDAKVPEVARWIASHRGIEDALFALCVVGAFALLVFAGAAYRQVAHGEGGLWAGTGLLGVAGVVAMFCVLVADELALVVAVKRGATAGTVETLWLLHNAAFTLLQPMIGVALLGFALASSATGLVSRWFRILGPIGAILLAVPALAAVATTTGSAVLFVGIAGFAIWLAWVASAGISMLRSAATVA